MTMKYKPAITMTRQRVAEVFHNIRQDRGSVFWSDPELNPFRASTPQVMGKPVVMT